MEEKYALEELDKIELMLDALLVQTVKRGIEYEEYIALDADDKFYGEFQQLNSWNRQFGYKFNIYHDHLIDDKKHFHFENKEKNIHLKMDFDGNILENIGKNEIDKNVHKVLKKFLKQPSIIEQWNKVYDKNNPVK